VSSRGTLGGRRTPGSIGGAFALMVVLTGTSIGAAGCASNPATTDTSKAPANVRVVAVAVPSASGSPKLATARAQAMAAYAGYIHAETTASTTADYGSPELTKYTSDPLLGQWITELFHLHAAGDVQRGSVISHPILVSVKLSAKSGTAIVRDCLDQSRISIVNATTGKVIPLPKSKPYVAIATMYLYSNGRWMVSKVDTTSGASC
jgi:hypothetical protein